MDIDKIGQVIVGEDYIEINNWQVSNYADTKKLRRYAMWRAVRRLLCCLFTGR
jgi:hypothetical protein